MTQFDIEEKTRAVLTQYPVKRAALFGSAAHGALKETSDVDILVEFIAGTPGIDFFGLKVDLEDALLRPVDLITYRALSRAQSEFKMSVEKEARTIYEQQNV